MSQQRNEVPALPILYEDETCFVVSKPAGISMHPGNGMKEDEKTMLDAIRPLFDDHSLSFDSSCVLVHRLDKETTGVLLIAKTKEDHEHFQKQFHDRLVLKQYLALVAGVPIPPAALIDAPIGRHGNHRTTMSVHHAVHGREARTTYRTLASTPQASLLLLDLHTGRTHQIRVHLSTLRHPLLGDTTYTSPTSLRLTEELGISSLCLHAWKLSITSRVGTSISVMAPLPETFTSALEACGLHYLFDK